MRGKLWGTPPRAASDKAAELGFLRLVVVRTGRGAENGPIDKVSSLIAGTLAKRGLAQHALASLAIHRINGWLSERFASAPPRVVRIADGTVVVACGHSIIAQELQAQLPELNAFIASECPFARISAVRLVRSDDAAGNALAPGNPPA